ncbi:MAG TPA: hypothetical protein VF516_44510 [Kofleriaceae bacterium]
MAKIELPEGWARVADPLRALMAEIERESHADGSAPPDLTAVSARWAQVSDAIRTTLRGRIASRRAQAADGPMREHPSDSGSGGGSGEAS